MNCLIYGRIMVEATTTVERTPYVRGTLRLIVRGTLTAVPKSTQPYVLHGTIKRVGLLA